MGGCTPAICPDRRDGFVYLVDRKKDMVLRGGENIYCAEVEACLHRHSAVAECCVFGVPDVRLGEEVAAAVVLRSGLSLTPEALRAHCAGHLAKHKIPSRLWVLTPAASPQRRRKIPQAAAPGVLDVRVAVSGCIS